MEETTKKAILTGVYIVLLYSLIKGKIEDEQLPPVNTYAVNLEETSSKICLNPIVKSTIKVLLGEENAYIVDVNDTNTYESIKDNYKVYDALSYADAQEIAYRFYKEGNIIDLVKSHEKRRILHK